ncbi:cytochrome P450 [Nocardia sp. NPDC051321]|uniref:cytochrome P450 n=1 Tax=Nocardia sp. NPDC051321 TaxID=3364323 RepID=UPI0037919A71
MNISKTIRRGKIWVRWLVLHGAAGMMLRLMARRGDPFATLLVGPGRGIDPYPDLERIRASGRVVPTPLLNLTVDLDVVRTIMRDSRFGATKPSHMSMPKPVRWMLEHTGQDLPNPTDPPALIALDPPDHSRLRRPVTSAFTAAAMRDMTDRIGVVTEQLLDELEPRSHADLIHDFAAKLPVAIIAHLLGVPEQDHPKLLEWGNSGAPLFDIGVRHAGYRRGIEALTEAQQYFGDHVDRLRIQPGPSIFGHVVATGGLAKHELMAIASIIMGAGFETAMNMLGSGIVLLLRNPDQLAKLRADPEQWPTAVEEILRTESPAQMTMRTAHEDVEIAGHHIRAGEVVMLLLGGANRDPERFTEPARFDVTREKVREHVAFGQGIHTCLGARLARLEGTIGLRKLFERFPNLALDGTPELRGLAVLRGFDRVPVRLGSVSDRRSVADPRVALPTA